MRIPGQRANVAACLPSPPAQALHHRQRTMSDKSYNGCRVHPTPRPRRLRHTASIRKPGSSHRSHACHGMAAPGHELAEGIHRRRQRCDPRQLGRGSGEMVPLTVVGTAEDEAGAVSWLADPRHHCDIAIVDIYLRRGTGLNVLRALQRVGRRRPIGWCSQTTPPTRSGAMRCRWAQAACSTSQARSTHWSSTASRWPPRRMPPGTSKPGAA